MRGNFTEDDTEKEREGELVHGREAELSHECLDEGERQELAHERPGDERVKPEQADNERAENAAQEGNQMAGDCLPGDRCQDSDRDW